MVIMFYLFTYYLDLWQHQLYLGSLVEGTFQKNSHLHLIHVLLLRLPEIRRHFQKNLLTHINPHKPTKNVNHSYLARANSRRRLGIVNPIDYVALSISIINNWKQLRTIHNKTRVSLTSPVYHGPPNRAFGHKYTYDKMDDLKAKVRSRSRYLFRADISQYYHSIYTHSIAWAIHGKKNG